MHFIAEYRTKLNCSQSQFASFLGCGRSPLAKIELYRNARLPLGPLGWITDEMRKLDETNSVDRDPSASLSEQDRDLLRQRLDVLLESILRCKRLLTSMQKAYQSAAIAKEYFDHLLSLPLDKLDPREVNATQKNWLRLELSRQVLEMEINGKLPQYQLEVKIAQLELEKAMTEKTLS